MLSKAGSGPEQRLICSDCGQLLSRHSGPAGGLLSKRSQLITVVLIALFGITTGGLMTLQDLQNPSLLEDETLNLREQQPSDGPTRRLSRLRSGAAAGRD
ncbi:MAG: hypothetical protein VKM92_07250 [Cyanobacteriota bacterium]|nr:hypothetical protein [Cyanobacteriota bacterium]